MRVKIHHEGNEILLIMLAIIAAVLVPMWLWVEPVAWPIAVSVVLGILFLLTLNFFRSPRRSFTGDPTDAVVASADGKVVALEEVFEDEAAEEDQEKEAETCES